MAMSQKEMILKHLRKHGSMTRLVAYDLYGIIDFRKRVSELRQEGYEINRVKMVDDIGRSYSRYMYATQGADRAVAA